VLVRFGLSHYLSSPLYAPDPVSPSRSETDV
jgi:hypothetical protein